MVYYLHRGIIECGISSIFQKLSIWTQFQLWRCAALPLTLQPHAMTIVSRSSKMSVSTLQGTCRKSLKEGREEFSFVQWKFVFRKVLLWRFQCYSIPLCQHVVSDMSFLWDTNVSLWPSRTLCMFILQLSVSTQRLSSKLHLEHKKQAVV